MVAIVTGTGLGLQRSSAWVLGSAGQLGDATFNRYGENVTVNGATGNLVIQRTDEILIGKGPDDNIVRTYNSLGAGVDDNGDNWRLNAQRQVGGLTGMVNTSGSTITRTDWDGSTEVYTYSATTSRYESALTSSGYHILTWNSSTSKWTWTDAPVVAVDADPKRPGLAPTGLTEVYDSTGKIISATDTGGNQVTYSYTSGKLTQVMDASGEHTDLTWSGNNITQITTYLSGGATLTRVRYTYDASNRLSTVTTDLSPTDNSISDGNTVVTTYTYDSTSTRVASISQTGGAYLAITYDGSNRVASFTQTTSSGVSRVTSFSYDTVNRVTTVTTNLTDSSGTTQLATLLKYDTNNDLTEIDLPAAQSGATAQVITYTYDSAGDVLTATDASGHAVTYTWDSVGNLLTQQDALGNTITRTYSGDEVLTETVTPGSGQGGTASTTRYAYDSSNRLRYVVSGEGRVIEYRYNSYGQRTATISYRSSYYDVSALSSGTSISESTLNSWVTGISDKSTIARTDTTYDFRGNVSTETTYTIADSSGNGLTSSPYTVVTYTYDQYGNLLTRATSGISNTEAFVYDGLGRITSSTDLNNATTTVAFTDSSNTAVVTLATGLTKTSVYNYAGEPITYTESATGITTGTTTYSYDSLGQLRMVTDALGRKSYSLYDNVGRKVADIAADGAIVEYGYDASNRLMKTIGYGNKLTSTKLATLIDGSGNPRNVALSTVRPTATSDDRWSWRVYDADDRVTETIDGTGSVTTYTYDSSSNVISTTTYANALSSAAVAGFKTAPPTNLTRLFNSAFSGTAGWGIGTDPSNITNGGSPFTDVWNGKNYIKSYFTATASGQVTSISTDATHSWPVTAGERLSVQAGVEGSGPVGSLQLRVWWQDASGATISSSTIGTLSGTQAFNTKISGFVVVPTGAVQARLEVAMTSSAAGAGFFSVEEPIVAAATANQTATPAFDAIPGGTQPANLTRLYNAALSGTDGWTIGYDPSNITNSGYPTTGVTAGKGYIRSNFTATSAQVTSIATDLAHLWPVTAGERLSIQAGVEGTGVIGTLELKVWFIDANGNAVSGASIGTLTGAQSFNTKISGFATVPAGAVKARLEVYMVSSGAGSGSFSIVEPMVALATPTQTAMPDFSAGTADPSPTILNRLTNSALSSTDGWGIGYDPFSITNAGYPTTGVTVGKSYIRSNFTATGSGQTTSISTDGTHWVPVSAGERLSVQAGVEATGAVGTLRLVVWWRDANNNSISSDTIKVLNGVQSFNTKIAGFATAPAGAITARLELYMDSSAAGSGSFSLMEPMLASAASNQTRMPDFNSANSGNVAQDNVTRSFYDKDGLLIGTLDATGHLSQIIYNKAGQKVETIEYINPSVVNWATGTFVALLAGVATSARDIHNRYFYDDRGLLRYTLDNNLRPTEYVYDNAGRLLNTIDYGASIGSTTSYTLAYVSGQISTLNLAANINDRRSWDVYDAAGRVKYTIDSVGHVVGRTYDAVGQLIQTTQYGTLDPLSSSPSVSTMDSWATAHAADVGNRNSFIVYDALGRTVYTIDALGEVVGFSYDAFGQLTKTVQYATTRTTTSSPSQSTMDSWVGTNAGASDRISRKIYDSNGRVVYDVDALGYVTEYQYDAGDRVNQTIRYVSSYTVTDTTTQASLASTIGTPRPLSTIMSSTTRRAT
jgi:YD repeat-containing protein